MTVLRTIEQLESELDELAERYPDVVGVIDALLDELVADDDLLDVLFSEVPKWHYLFKPPFEIKRFEACWQSGRRVYILKPYDEDGHLIDFRLFLGHDIRTDECFVLTVQHRSTCYDTTTTAYRNLCVRYDQLDIPAVRRNS